MRKISTLFLALVLSSIALPISVEGQTRVCPDMSVFSGSMLQWLTGKGQVNTTASSGLGTQLTQLASAGKEAELRSKLNAPGADSLSGLGVFWLALGDVESSVRAFDLDSLPDTACSQRELKLAARYLKQYGSQTPLFPGFNGGFYQFLKDSLYGGEKLSVERYEKALSALYGWMRMTGFGSPLAMELFADVLYRHPDRFVGNFFGCMAYMRAATMCEGASREVLMTKALYALEAPNSAARRFDRYRFTQLQKAFLAACEGKDKGEDA